MGELLSSATAFIGALFVFGTLSFWIISALFLSWVIWITEVVDETHAIFATVLLALFVWVLSSVNDFTVTAHPLQWLKWIGIYLAIGTGWSILKWISLLYRYKDKLKAAKESFEEKGFNLVDGKISTPDWKEFTEHLYKVGYKPNNQLVKTREDVIPTVKNRFGDLTRWIVWWPTSAFWTILNDPLRRIAEYIVKNLKQVYTRIADAVFSEEV